MTSLLARYREAARHEHGWEVPLRCPRCGTDAVPEFLGWTPTRVIRFGGAPTIYADLSCPNCGADLKEAAGGRLVELFADRPIPRANRRLLGLFLAFILPTSLGGTLLLVAWRHLGLSRDWRDVGLALVRLPLLLLAPAILWFHYRIASIRRRCECGRPDTKFMGLLGRSSCYRCSSCGRLLRLRD